MTHLTHTTSMVNTCKHLLYLNETLLNRLLSKFYTQMIVDLVFVLGVNEIPMGWQKHSEHPERVTAMGCAHFEGNLYTFGGLLPEGIASSKIHKYSDQDSSWSLLKAELPAGGITKTTKTINDQTIWIRDASNMTLEFDFPTEDLSYRSAIPAVPFSGHLKFIYSIPPHVLGIDEREQDIFQLTESGQCSYSWEHLNSLQTDPTPTIISNLFQWRSGRLVMYFYKQRKGLYLQEVDKMGGKIEEAKHVRHTALKKSAGIIINVPDESCPTSELIKGKSNYMITTDKQNIGVQSTKSPERRSMSGNKVHLIQKLLQDKQF